MPRVINVSIAVLICALYSPASAGSSPPPPPPPPPFRQLASWDYDEPAVAVLVPPNPNAPPAGFPGTDSGSGYWSLLLATFGFTSGDGVWGMKDISAAAKDPSHASDMSFAPLDISINWPNFAEMAPSPLGPSGWGAGKSLILEAGGFFPNPMKATGTVVINDVSDIKNPSPVTISHPKSGYFYHQAQLVDINGDGRLDVVAARALKPTIPFKAPVGELVWLEQPPTTPGAPFNATWIERVLISPHGPDVSFLVHDFDGDGSLEVLAGQYFDAQALTLFWCGLPWDRCPASGVSSRVIAGNLGPMFTLSLSDLNGDGREDILLTTNAADGSGRAYGVEIPSGDVRTTPWPVHPLGPAGYAPRNRFLPGQGGPGNSKAFAINSHTPTAKPTVLVSGDDNGTVCLLTPTSGDSSDWSYDFEILYSSSKGTVGTPAIADIDGDGWAEVVVPSYAENTVLLFSFSPETPSRKFQSRSFS